MKEENQIKQVVFGIEISVIDHLYSIHVDLFVYCVWRWIHFISLHFICSYFVPVICCFAIWIADSNEWFIPFSLGLDPFPQRWECWNAIVYCFLCNINNERWPLATCKKCIWKFVSLFKQCSIYNRELFEIFGFSPHFDGIHRSELKWNWGRFHFHQVLEQSIVQRVFCMN